MDQAHRFLIPLKRRRCVTSLTEYKLQWKYDIRKVDQKEIGSKKKPHILQGTLFNEI